MTVAWDKQDRALLALLQSDASLSVAELAERVGMSKSACWRRLQKFDEQGVVRQKVTLLNQDAVNLPLTVYVSIRTNEHTEQWSNNFREVINELPEVLEVYRMSGDLDYLIKAVVKDMPGYDQFYKRLIKAKLFDVSSSFVMETMKQTSELPLDNLPLKSG
ncbi:MAG: Lrp/AsnC family transcriptional regulator [Cellvibrionaceae bacterium]